MENNTYAGEKKAANGANRHPTRQSPRRLIMLILHFDDNLAEVSPLPHIVQRFFGLLKVEDFINNRPDLMLVTKRQHLFEAISRSVQESLERQILLDSRDVDVDPFVCRVDFARHIPDAVDQTPPVEQRA